MRAQGWDRRALPQESRDAGPFERRNLTSKEKVYGYYLNIGWHYFRVENKGDSFFKKEFGLCLVVF